MVASRQRGSAEEGRGTVDKAGVVEEGMATGRRDERDGHLYGNRLLSSRLDINGFVVDCIICC